MNAHALHAALVTVSAYAGWLARIIDQDRSFRVVFPIVRFFACVAALVAVLLLAGCVRVLTEEEATELASRCDAYAMHVITQSLPGSTWPNGIHSVTCCDNSRINCVDAAALKGKS